MRENERKQTLHIYVRFICGFRKLLSQSGKVNGFSPVGICLCFVGSCHIQTTSLQYDFVLIRIYYNSPNHISEKLKVNRPFMCKIVLVCKLFRVQPHYWIQKNFYRKVDIRIVSHQDECVYALQDHQMLYISCHRSHIQMTYLQCGFVYAQLDSQMQNIYNHTNHNQMVFLWYEFFCVVLNQKNLQMYFHTSHT